MADVLAGNLTDSLRDTIVALSSLAEILKSIERRVSVDEMLTLSEQALETGQGKLQFSLSTLYRISSYISTDIIFFLLFFHYSNNDARSSSLNSSSWWTPLSPLLVCLQLG